MLLQNTAEIHAYEESLNSLQKMYMRKKSCTDSMMFLHRNKQSFGSTEFLKSPGDPPLGLRTLKDPSDTSAASPPVLLHTGTATLFPDSQGQKPGDVHSCGPRRVEVIPATPLAATVVAQVNYRET